jgi:hypothetical protein
MTLTVKASERMILGHMPMVGISYQSDKKDMEYRERFSIPGAMREVMDAALQMGVRRFAAATSEMSPLASSHVSTLREMTEEGHGIEVLPCIMVPLRLRGGKVDAFRRWATYISFEEREHSDVRGLVLEDPILNFREGWRQRLPTSKPYVERDFEELKIDWDRVEGCLDGFTELDVRYVEPGSETDFLAMTGRLDLLGELVDRIKGRGFQGVLFGVHHAGTTIPILEEGLTGFEGYVTPLNSRGIMMLPSKSSAEEAIRATRKAVYAIKPLAGGRISPDEAFRHVFEFDVEGCMVGCASVEEVRVDIEAARRAIS